MGVGRGAEWGVASLGAGLMPGYEEWEVGVSLEVGVACGDVGVAS